MTHRVAAVGFVLAFLASIPSAAAASMPLTTTEIAAFHEGGVELPSGPTDRILPATRDTYVDRWIFNRWNRNGSLPWLIAIERRDWVPVDGGDVYAQNTESLVAFDLPGTCGETAISRAVLALDLLFAAPDDSRVGDLRLRTVATGWSEETTDWWSRPSSIGEPIGPLPHDGGMTVRFDVTETLIGADGRVDPSLPAVANGWVITGGDGLTFASRERDAEAAPRLVLSGEPCPAP